MGKLFSDGYFAGGQLHPERIDIFWPTISAQTPEIFEQIPSKFLTLTINTDFYNIIQNSKMRRGM